MSNLNEWGDPVVTAEAPSFNEWGDSVAQEPGGANAWGDPIADDAPTEPASTGFAGLMARPAPEPEKDFWDTADAISGIWDMVSGLGVTAPAAFYQLTEGLDRPDQYSDKAKKAFEAADAYALEMQKKTLANQKAGKSSSFGETARETGQSLGFTLGSMAVAIPSWIAGAKVGAVAGAAITSPTGPGAALGATGGAIIGTGTAMVASGAASGAAAYRMAGAAFLYDAFKAADAEAIKERGYALTEEEKAKNYETLLPIAQNTALWEAGPEAVGNAVSLGAGKLLFGKSIKGAFIKAVGGTAAAAKPVSGATLSKAIATISSKATSETDKKFVAEIAKLTGAGMAPKLALQSARETVPKALLDKVSSKVLAVAGTVVTELATEAATQVEQNADQLKVQAIAEGRDPDVIKADWSVEGYSTALKEVYPQTLMLLGAMGGGATAVKGTIVGAEKGIQKLKDLNLIKTAQSVEESFNAAAEFASTQEDLSLPLYTEEALRQSSDEARIDLSVLEQAGEATEYNVRQREALDALFGEDGSFDADGAAKLFRGRVDRTASDEQVDESGDEFISRTGLERAAEKTRKNLENRRDGISNVVSKVNPDGSVEYEQQFTETLNSKDQGVLDAINSNTNEDGSVNHEGLASALGYKLKSVKSGASTAPAASAAPATPAAKPSTFKLGETEIPTADTTPQATLQAVFGKPKTGHEYRDDINPADLSVRADGQIIYQDSVVLNRAVENGFITNRRSPVVGQSNADPVGLFQRKLPEEQAAPLSRSDVQEAADNKAAFTQKLRDENAALQQSSKTDTNQAPSAKTVTASSDSITNDDSVDEIDISPSPLSSAKERKTSLTKEAQDLLKSGGVPGFISNNLRKIASDNGVEVTSSMRPGDIIDTLREKQSFEKSKTPTEPLPKAQAFPTGKGEAAPEVESTQPVSVAAKPKSQSRTPEDVEKDIAKLHTETERQGGKKTTESFKRKLERLKEEKASLETTSLQSPGGLSKGAIKQIRIGGRDEMKHVTKDTTGNGGTITGNGLGELEVGTPIVVESKPGKAAFVRVVLGRTVNEKGEVVYTVSRPINNDEAFTADHYNYARIPSPESETKAAGKIADSILNATTPNEKAVTALLKQILSRVVGQDAADKLFALSFTNVAAEAILVDDTSFISVNPQVWVKDLQAKLRGLSRNSAETDGIIEDWVAEIESTMWHEAHHIHLLNFHSSNRGVVMSAMESLIEHAAKDEGTRAMLGQSARGRYHHLSVLDGKLKGISDDQVLALLRGEEVNGVTLSEAKIRSETRALGAEFAALFTQNLHSGMDPAAIREAADRFIARLIPNPTLAEPGALKVMLERLAELLQRSVEAMARFMRAHRMAKTLPKEFLQLSLDIDQAMKGAGITVPDSTRVVERFSSQASQRMANVVAAENELKMREWLDGGQRNTEWDIKSAVQELVRLSRSEDPEMEPIFFDPYTGRMEVSITLDETIGEERAKEMQELLSRLNDPRRSAMALEARQIAADTRLVLRNLNAGIPANSKLSRVDDSTFASRTFGMDFETSSAILFENLEVEVLQRTGFTAEDIISQINKTIVNLPAPVAPPNLSAVRNAARTLRHTPLDELQESHEKLLQQAQGLEKDAASADGKKKANLLARAGTLRQKMMANDYAQRLIINHLENFHGEDATKMTPVEVVRMEEMKLAGENLRNARRLQLAAELSYNQAKALFASRASKLRDFTNLVNSGLDLSGLNSLLHAEGSLVAGIDTNQLEASLARSNSLMRAFARLSALPDELEYFMIGGFKPASMRSEGRNKAWAPVGQLNTKLDASRQFLPVNAFRVLWNREEPGLKPDNIQASLSINSQELGNLVFSTEGDFNVMTVANMAAEVVRATGASERLLGLEPVAKSSEQTEEERTERFIASRRNATALASTLVGNMRTSMIEGDASVTSSVLARGGFAANLEVTKEGVEEGVMPQTLLPIPTAPDFDKSGEKKSKEQGRKDWKESMSNVFDGTFASDMVLSAADLLDRMAGRGVFEEALLHHSGGLTPAGAVNAIISPRFIDFLALTKGTEFQKRMRAGIKEGEDAMRFDTIYESLVPNIEKTPSFAKRRDGEGFQGAAMKSIHSLRRGAIMADVIYKESINEAARQTKRNQGWDSTPENFGETSESRSPISEEGMRNAAFNHSQIRREAQSVRLLGDAEEQSGVGISLLRPVAAEESLRILDQLENEQRNAVLVGKEITAGKLAEWDDARIILEGDNRQEKADLTPTSDQMTNAGREWMMDNLRRNEERLMEREERVITQLMLSLYGGDEQVVRRILNSPEFVSYKLVGGAITEGQIGERTILERTDEPQVFDAVEQPGRARAAAAGYHYKEVEVDVKDSTFTTGGIPTRHWDRAAIRNHIRAKLDALHQEEMDHGVIRSGLKNGGRNTVFDEAFNGVEASEGVEKKAGLIERNPAYAGILRAVMLSGGSIYTGTAPTAFSSEALEVDPDGKLEARYDADTTSVLYALMGKIGNVSVISGRVDWNRAQGDKETQVPNIAFIPDEKHPMLVVPYGKIQPTTEEAALAIEAVLEWLGKYGGVDFQEIAQPIIESFSQLNQPGLSSITAKYRQALGNYLELMKVKTLTEEDRAMLNSFGEVNDESKGAALAMMKKYGVASPELLLTRAEQDARIGRWTESAITRIRELLADPMGGLSDILNPDPITALTGPFQEEDPEYWAGEAMQDAYRKVIARLLTSPAAKELLIYTTFENGAPTPSADEQSAFGDLVGFHSVRGLDAMASRDEMLYQADKGFAVTDDRGVSVENIRRGNDFGGIGGDNMQALDAAGSLLAEDGSEALMPPVVPLQAEWANAALYQMLREISPSQDTSSPLEGQQKKSGLSEYQARQMIAVFGEVNINGQSMTVDQLMEATGKQAKIIQERFQSWAHAGIVPDSGNNIAPAREINKRFRAYSMLDPLNGIQRTWDQNRIWKGALLYAELLGAVFETRHDENGNNSKTRYAEMVPDLAAMEAEAKRRRLPINTLTTLNAAGRPLKGYPETVSIFEAMRRQVFGEAAHDHRFIDVNTKLARRLIKRHENLLKSLEATQEVLDAQYESLGDMMTRLDDESAPSKLALDTIRSFISSREEAAHDLAVGLVDRLFAANTGRDLALRSGDLVHSENSLVKQLSKTKREYTGLRKDVIAGLSQTGEITQDSLLYSSRYTDHNSHALTLFKELSEIAPQLFSRTGHRAYRVEVGDTSRDAERKISDLTGLINRIDDPSFLRRRIRSNSLRQIISAPFSVASEIRPMGQGITDISDRISLSEESQSEVLSALRKVRAEAKPSTSEERRAQYTNAVASIIFKQLYGGADMVEQSMGAIQAKLNEMAEAAKDGKLRDAADVLRVMMAVGQIELPSDSSLIPFPAESGLSPITNPLTRNAAIAKLLRTELREQARKSASLIEQRVNTIEDILTPKDRIAAFRVPGYSSLTLMQGEAGGRTVGAVEVEIVRRVLESYGTLWSKLYMRSYGKSDFTVGMATTEQAAIAADSAAEAGFGSLGGIAPGERFKLVDGILEPENALERIAAVLATRGQRKRKGVVERRIMFINGSPMAMDMMSSETTEKTSPRPTTPEIVLARFRKNVRQAADIRIGEGLREEIAAIKKELASEDFHPVSSRAEYKGLLKAGMSRNKPEEEGGKVLPRKAIRKRTKARQERLARAEQALAEFEAGAKVKKKASEEIFEIPEWAKDIDFAGYDLKRSIKAIESEIELTKADLVELRSSLPTPAKYRAFLESKSREGSQSTLNQIERIRAEIKSQETNLRALEQRLKEYEAGLLVENESEPISLFSPADAADDSATFAAFADLVLSRLKRASSRRTEREKKSSKLGDEVYGDFTMENVTRDQFRFQLETTKGIDVGGYLEGIKGSDGIDLGLALSEALKQIESDPNSDTAQKAFHEVQAKAISAVWAKDKADLWATGYVHTKKAAETTWFFRAMLHQSAKVAGVFANSIKSIDSVNEVRSILRKGNDTHGGLDRVETNNEATRKKVAEALDAIPKEGRFKAAARGWLFAQFRSYLEANGANLDSVESFLDILTSAETGISLANLRSSGGRKAKTLGGKIKRKVKQGYNMLNEKGFHQIDNQLVMLDMFDDLIPMLEKIQLEGSDSDVANLIDSLGQKWGKDAVNYGNLIADLFSEHRKGLENILVMRGASVEDFQNKPTVPIVWANPNAEHYTSSEIKSMSEMLAPERSIWMRSSFRSGQAEEGFSLLDYDGITAPLRVMEDMLFRTMMAPTYDSVAAIVGDVSIASEGFSQFAPDENGNPKSGFIIQMAKKNFDDKLMSYDEYKRAESGSLAVANMIRDELMNHLTGFSAASRLINTYRKIAVTGLARKLFSFTQPIAQTGSPVAGYVATNGERGIRFIPIFTRYLGGIASRGDTSQSAAFAKQINDLVKDLAPTVANRAADSNQYLQEVMQDSGLNANETMRSPFLGRAEGVARPLLNAAGGTLNLMSKWSAKSLELLIARPEESVINPMFVHEILEEVNRERPGKEITIDQMLAERNRWIKSRHVHAATVKVEQLFGTASRMAKGQLSQPSKNFGDELGRSMLTTLAGHPISMAANSWAASRMMMNNKVGSPEFKEGQRILMMTISQNMIFVFVKAPAITYLLSVALAAMLDWDEDERQDWEGSLYGIDRNDDPAERRKKLSYWAMAMLGRSEDPYGYAWHKNDWTDAQQDKHDGYRNARIIQELINQAPVIGSLTSTTLGGSAIEAGLKATGISPKSSVKQAGVILPEKWGFTGTAATPGEDTGYSERAIYLATKLWFNYLNDSNSAAFAIDPLIQSLKMAANNPDDLDAMDALMIGATLLAPKPREFDTAIERQYPELNPNYEALAPWEN